MNVLLESDRLVLRRFTLADADDLFKLDNDPEVMRFLNGGAPTPREVIRDEILPLFTRYDERVPASGFWACVERATGAFVGWFSFRWTGAVPGEVSLGFRMCRAAWGRGYATEGARALIDRGRSEWGVRRVVATTYEENHGSRRVLANVGMRLVRRFRLTPSDLASVDTYHLTEEDLWEGDDLEYALELGDWEEQELG